MFNKSSMKWPNDMSGIKALLKNTVSKITNRLHLLLVLILQQKIEFRGETTETSK